MKRTLSLVIIIAAFSRVSFGQIPATFQIRHYTTENGLPANGIKGIQWDEATGFLWVATEGGLVRFNGSDFKTYTNKNTPFIGSERFRFVVRSNNGVIYAADDHENVLEIRRNAPVVFSASTTTDIPARYYAYYGLQVSDTFFFHKTRHPVQTSLMEALSARETFPLTDTSVLFVNNEGPIAITLTNDNPVPLVDETIPVRTAFKVGDQVFLVTSKDEVFHVDILSHHLLPARFDETFEKEFSKGNLHFFWNAVEKNSIVVKDNKAWTLSYNGTMILAQEVCDTLPKNILIKFIQYSQEKKILFVATDAKGLFVISQNRVTVVRKKQTAIDETNAYYSQIELPGNRVLTDVGDILGPRREIDRSLPAQEKFWNSYLTPDSLLWYNTRSGSSHLSCLSYKTGLTKEYDEIPIQEHFGLSYSDGKVYIANNEGLGVLQDDSLHYFFHFKYDVRDNTLSPYTMTELSPGVFAVSLCPLLRLNTITGIMDTLLASAGNCIRSLWKFKDYVFIGTYGKGFYIYRNGKMRAMPLDKNNFLSYVHGFIADKYGYCWMSTNHGLFKSRLTDLVNAFEHNDNKIYYHYFGRNDGMDITEMNGSYSPNVLQLQNGTISFPTMDGLLWIDPGKAVPIMPSGDIYIDEVEVDNEKINADSLAKKPLPSNTSEIVIQIGFSAWCNKENIYIDYDLNNSGKWKAVNVDHEAVIRLSELSHGSYKLRIRKMNGFGTGNYSYKDFNFHISTPWYQQWWFYILTVLIVVGAGALFIRIRIRQYALQKRKLEKQVLQKTKELQLKNEMLEKNDTIKTRLISIISHDIITPLKFLTVAGKNLLQKKQLMSEEMQNETISEITNTSQDLQLLSTNILNWIKYQNENRRLVKENFNAHELINQVLSVLTSLAKQKQLYLSNEVDKELTVYQYAEPIRILIYNLVSNAINFSEKGNIVIGGRRQTHHLVISVKDEGIGMTAEQVSNIMGDQVVITAARQDSRKGHGLGYLIIKDLIKMIGAEIIVDSEKGKGTTVSIKVPSE